MRRSLSIAVGVALALTATVALAGRNSSGTMSFTSVAGGYPAIPGQVISSSGWNANMAEIATELTDSASRSGKGGFTAPVRGADGSVSLPAFSFTNDTNSGVYRIGTDNLGIATGGTKRIDISNTGVAFTDPVAFASSVSVAGGFHGAVTFADPVTFSTTVTVQTPTANTNPATKLYVDGALFSPEYVGTGYTANYATYYRAGKMVAVNFKMTGTNGTSYYSDVFRLPSGYRPANPVMFAASLNDVGGFILPVLMRVAASGSVGLYYWDNGSGYTATGTIGGADVAGPMTGADYFEGSVTFYADGN